MLGSKRAFVAINLALGPLVPASYVWSARQWPQHTGKLWGSIEGMARNLYTGNMLLATLGYLLFSWWFFRHARAAEQGPASDANEGDSTAVSGNGSGEQPGGSGTLFLGRYGLGAVNLGYLLVLSASLLWMPLSLYALANNAALMGAIVAVLTTVALGSLLLAACLFSAQPAIPRGTLLRARIGVVFFCLQTVLLDAIIWPNAFSL